jgi:beta-galactosidase
MRPARIPVLFLLICSVAAAQDLPLGIDLSAPVATPLAGHLKMGGANPEGVEIHVNGAYLTLNGRPWFPVMGEMHYSRYPHEEWEREIMKMKAGGINVVSAYIFWIHHEEIENQWDWAGDKDLRQFVRLCARHGMYVWLRLGPWDHGEARNGGFPDWLVAKFANTRLLRTTDPRFMGETRKLYSQIFEQVKGLLYKDGGPIIGIQVENEMRNNAPYLLALKTMAKEIGLDVPLYSMTGWGPARVPQDELLPMFGGYGDGFWIAGSTVSGQSRVQYFFTQNPNDERVQMSSAPGSRPASMNYLSRYPYLTCEIGGGMAIAYARRPLMSWQDVAAVALDKLGNGSCLMGYYMYQGGGNPAGKLSTLQELESTKITNDNDLPVVDYDFQAPLGQFGQVRESYHALRMLHMFIADFGSELCTMPATLPPVLPKDLNDTTTLRWEARSDGHGGFIFINNHERGAALPAKEAQFDLKLADGEQIVPEKPVTIPTDAFMIWPFNLDMGGIRLHYATAQLLCKLDGPEPTYVFFAPDGVKPEFAFDEGVDARPHIRQETREGMLLLDPEELSDSAPESFLVSDSSGKRARIILASREQAWRYWKVPFQNADRLVTAGNGASISWDDQALRLEGNDPDLSFSVYPRPDQAGPTPGAYRLPVNPRTVAVTVEQIKTAGPARAIELSRTKKPLPPTDADFDAAAVWHISLPPDALDGVEDVRLRIDYTGDVARAYVGERLIDDDYYYGRPWEIGLRRFGPEALEKGITVKILPLRGDSPVAIDPAVRPAAGVDGVSLELRGVTAEPVYAASIPAK